MEKDQVLPVIEASGSPYDYQVVKSVLTHEQDLTVYYADSKKLLYGSTAFESFHPHVLAIYEYDFSSDSTRQLYAFSPAAERFSVSSVFRHADDYYIAWFDQRTDEQGYFTYYFTRLKENKLEHIVEMKAKLVWQLPSRFYVESNMASSLYQIDEQSEVKRLVINLETDDYHSESVEQLQVEGLYISTKDQQTEQAHLFQSNLGKKIFVHYVVDDKVFIIPGDHNNLYGLLGNKLLVGDNNTKRINVYDAQLKPVGSFRVPGKMYLLNSLSESITFYQMDNSMNYLGYIKEDDNGISLVSIPAPVYKGPLVSRDGFSIAYSFLEDPYRYEKHPEDDGVHQLIHVYFVNWNEQD